MLRSMLFGVTLVIPMNLAAQQHSGVDRAIRSITAEDVARRVGILANDSMRGRNTPSPELDQAAAWIGEEFGRMGLRPGGDDGGFIQRYTLRRVRLDTAASGVWGARGSALRFGRDAAVLNGASGPDGVEGHPILLTGAPTDPAQLQSLRIEGRIVIWVMPSNAGGAANFALNGLLSRGPGAIVLVTPRPDATFRQQLRRTGQTSLRTGWSSQRGPLIVEVREQGLARLLGEPGINPARAQSRTFESETLDDITLKVTAVSETVEETSAPNVVGILDGSDPLLKDEYLVFSAHMDHDGVRAPVNGDSIYNGADDNASGTVAIMELAEAFAHLTPRPRRSIIFLGVSGEEKGLWGSEYFAANPVAPIEQIVANVNADMVGRNWPDTIVVIGKEHSDLGETLNEVNAEHPELNMTAIDDIWPEENFYRRSDHFNFARRGVPILFFFNGTHDDYHRPSDHPELIDAEKESRIVKLMFYLGLEVAQRDARPQWDPASYATIVDAGVSDGGR